MHRTPRWGLAFIVLVCSLVTGSPAAFHVGRIQAAPARQTLPAPRISLSTNQLGNLFQPGQQMLVNLAISNPATITRVFTETETLDDYSGNQTALLTNTLTLAASQAITTTITPPIQSQGYFEVHVALADQATGGTTSAFITLGVRTPQAAVLDPASAFGVNGSLTGAYGGTQQALNTAAAVMAGAGVRYSREEFNWLGIQPAAGTGPYNFARTDAAVIAARQAGIQILGLVDYWGSLPQPDTTTSVVSGTTTVNTITGCSKGPVCAYTPQGDALFANYAAAVVARYRPGGSLAQQEGWTDNYGVTNWEVWNEPSTITFWRHDLANYQQLFASMYVATYAAIHRQEPGAKVMYDESGSAFDNAVAAARGKSDIIAVHSYSGGLDPDSALTSPTLPRGGQGTAPAALGGLVAQGIPVWITETGYATDGTVSPRQQAQYLVRSYVDFLATGVKTILWFKFHEDAPGGDNTYSMVNQDFSPKPAFLAYNTMTSHLQDATFATAVQLGTAVRGDLFTLPHNGGTEAVLWSTAENGTITITSTGTLATPTADDLMNNPVGTATPGGLVVPLSGDPVFVTIPGASASQLAPLLAHAPITGINPVGVVVGQASGLSNGLPNVKVTVSARIDLPISGTVSLALPPGWTTPMSSTIYPTLQPGQSRTLDFRLNSEVNHPDDVLSATATAADGLAATNTTGVVQYALTYGHPSIDGTLATWSTASIADMGIDSSQVVGIPGWTPQNLSARIYTMWDEHYFYLAARVYDVNFDYAPIGYNMYQGDSIQYGWGMDANAWLRNTGTNRYNVTAGLTHQGPADFQYNLLGPLPGMLVNIKQDPTNPHLTVYTTAIPWSYLGKYVPAIGKQFVFNLLVNQNENKVRIGWIQFAPGIGIGFYPSEWPFWTIIGSNPAAGLRIGGFSAPRQGTLNFTLPTQHGTLVLHNGGLTSLTLTINGTTLTYGGTASGAQPLPRTGDTTIDISQYVHAGANTIQAVGSGPSRAAVGVLSVFQ